MRHLGYSARAAAIARRATTAPPPVEPIEETVPLSLQRTTGNARSHPSHPRGRGPTLPLWSAIGTFASALTKLRTQAPATITAPRPPEPAYAAPTQSAPPAGGRGPHSSRCLWSVVFKVRDRYVTMRARRLSYATGTRRIGGPIAHEIWGHESRAKNPAPGYSLVSCVDRMRSHWILLGYECPTRAVRADPVPAKWDTLSFCPKCSKCVQNLAALAGSRSAPACPELPTQSSPFCDERRRRVRPRPDGP
jgi:hypothetical protein